MELIVDPEVISLHLVELIAAAAAISPDIRCGGLIVSYKLFAISNFFIITLIV